MAIQLPELRRLAVPSVCFLICFLAYSSQWLFYHIEPGPLSRKEALVFNALVCCTWWSYAQACLRDPGRLPEKVADVGVETVQDGSGNGDTTGRGEQVYNSRWCKKCKAVKPPRAHHCRQCGRCIPKMDHHCPWTSNCVSHTTFPHFLRFVLCTVISLLQLAHRLYLSLYSIYENRNLPAHLGPSILQLIHLLILCFITGILLFALTILLVTATWSLCTNITMIEKWEIERHEALVGKARKQGGYLYGPGGRRIRIRHQEFPYDVGVWHNMVQGMGTRNILAWLLPFGGGPSNEGGWGPWEVNGFEDEGTEWPPADPDKMPREPVGRDMRDVGYGHQDPRRDGVEDDVDAFRRRQKADMERWRGQKQENDRDNRGYDDDGYDTEEYEEGMDGEEGWTNSDGDRLRDYGVDEDAEVIVGAPAIDADDDEDVPLGELLRRRRRAAGLEAV